MGKVVSLGLLAALATVALAPSAASGSGGAAPVALDCDPFALAGPAPGAARLSEAAAEAGVVEHNVEEAYELALAGLPGASARRARVAGPIRVPVYVHVIQASADLGVIGPGRIASQIDVLNDSFNGTTGGDNTGFTFELIDTDVTINPAWSLLEPDTPQETAMKTALREGGARALNLYVIDLPAPMLGWGTFPYLYASEPVNDGIVVENDSLPGGPPPYGEGDTATHEAGHWLGLFHTFQGGCAPPGDFVDDTPAEAIEHLGCIPGDSCPADPGNDPLDNFMSYADDICMHRFTAGQTERAHELTAQLRNGAPVTSGQAISVSAGRATAVNVQANDPDGDPLSYSVSDPPDHGTIGGGGAALTYKPRRDYTGPDSFAVQATDVFGAAGAATVRIDVKRLRMKAKAQRKQRLGRLTVRGSCGGERCKVAATGKIVARGPGGNWVAHAARTFKLKRASGRAEPNRSAELRLRVAKSKRRLLDLLTDGWKAKAKVTVTATGAGGQKSRQKTSVVVTR